jgi:glutathione S-transferase
VRVERSDWPALKPTMPMHQMPCLQLDDGHKLCQSMAIARYLARKYSRLYFSTFMHH